MFCFQPKLTKHRIEKETFSLAVTTIGVQDCSRFHGWMAMANGGRLTRDGGDGSVADVGFGKVEIIADDGNEWRRGERRQEAGEEGDPGEVEGAHVRRGETEEPDGFRLVLAVHWQGKL